MAYGVMRGAANPEDPTLPKNSKKTNNWNAQSRWFVPRWPTDKNRKHNFKMIDLLHLFWRSRSSASTKNVLVLLEIQIQTNTDTCCTSLCWHSFLSSVHLLAQMSCGSLSMNSLLLPQDCQNEMFALMFLIWSQTLPATGIAEPWGFREVKPVSRTSYSSKQK